MEQSVVWSCKIVDKTLPLLGIFAVCEEKKEVLKLGRGGKRLALFVMIGRRYSDAANLEQKLSSREKF